jgi:hypothetical protein
MFAALRLAAACVPIKMFAMAEFVNLYYFQQVGKQIYKMRKISPRNWSRGGDCELQFSICT